MKKMIYISPIILLTACFSSHSKSDNLPAFNLLMLDSTTVFNTRDIPEGKPSLMIFFSPDCEHCQAETESILKNIDSLKNVQIYFVTIDPMDRMKVFNGYYHLVKYPNITVGRDYTYFFPRFFKNASPPYSVIYDRDKIFRRFISGETTASKLIALINNL